MTMLSDGKALVGLWFDGQRHVVDMLSDDRSDETLPVFELTKEWLDRYFRREIPDFTPPIALNGTSFRMEVWDILRQIPYGKTRSYKEIAEEMALRMGLSRMSAQAVGGAVGHNPISIIIPCHRVIGSNGSLTGYAGGLEKKIFLLELEGINITKFARSEYEKDLHRMRFASY